MSLLGLFVASAFGATLVRILTGPGTSGRGLVGIALGAGLGIALFSALRYWCLVASVPPSLCNTIEIVLSTIALFVCVRLGRSHQGDSIDPVPADTAYRPGRVILAILLLLQASMTLQVFQKAAEDVPFGLWDAWAFWNVRARALSLPEWQRAFDGSIRHPDYPLLVPLTVVRGWDWTGNTGDEVPYAVAVVFFLITVSLLFALLRALRGTSSGLMAVAVCLSTAPVMVWAASQQADIPLAFYFLGTLGCMACALDQPRYSHRWLALLGLTLSAAAWTKNEGLAWAVIGIVTTSTVLLLRRLPRRGFLWFAAGLAPLGVTLAVFELAHAGPNDLVADQSGEGALAKLTDFGRHRLIWEYFLDNVPAWVIGLAIYALLLGRRRSSFTAASLWMPVQLAGIAIAYYLVYLLTPHDLNWHLRTSIDRLIVQVWPGFLFVSFFFLRTPEELLATRASARK
jgi:hypothetical protein